MSRYTIRDDGQFEVVVGWDPPLRTLFLQVYDKSQSEDDGPLVWRGLSEKLQDLQQFRTLVTEWAPLSEEMSLQLTSEMVA